MIEAALKISGSVKSGRLPSPFGFVIDIVIGLTLGLALICSVGPCWGQVFIEGAGADEDPVHAQRAQRDDLDAKLSALAGGDAVFCGDVSFRKSARRANRCVRRALRQRKAFYVGYDSGHDDRRYTSRGVAMDPQGQMYEVWFDSTKVLPWVYDGEISDNSHILTMGCPTPHRLYEGRDGGIIPRGWHLPRANQLSCVAFGK